MNERRRSIFITGAATGIGRAAALLFGEKGWYVGGVDVNEKELGTLVDELGADNCFTYAMDVRDRSAFETALGKFGENTSGKLDILFNNAGIGGGGGPFEDVPFETHMAIVEVNLIGVMNGIYSAIPMLKATDNSLCFTTSSSAATYGAPYLASYTTTKFAVRGLTEALSVEFARFNSRAADVLPLVIDTPIWGDVLTQAKARGERGTRMGRIIPASDVAEVVWQAYHSDKLHWYVPEELVRVVKAKGESPEKVRDLYVAGNPFSYFDRQEDTD